MAFVVDYVRKILKPLEVLFYAEIDDTSGAYIFAGQFDPSVYEEIIAPSLPDGWYQDSFLENQLNGIPNLTSYINASTTNQAEMFRLLAGITLAYNNNNVAVAHEIIDDSIILTPGQKADMTAFLV